MTSIWRVIKAKNIGAAFSGFAAARHGGRWNNPGTPVIYCAGSLSLAILESFVNMGDEGRGIAMAYFRIDIPDGIEIQEVATGQLPSDWDGKVAAAGTKDLGSAWAASGESCILVVPSVVTPGEHNYVLNPLHLDFARLQIAMPEEFVFDARMWKG